MEGGTSPRNAGDVEPSDDVKTSKTDLAEKSTDVDAVVQTRAQRLRARVQFATLCWTLYLAGWNDGALGPLLPRVHSFYGVSYAVLALIFIFSCMGYLSGAFANMALGPRYGFGKVIVIGSVLRLLSCSIQVAAPPFPAFLLGCTIDGIGTALQDAQANGFVASFGINAEAKMGILHAAYGAGALLSPFVASQFAQLPRWSFHFLVSMGMQLINVVLLIAVFRFKKQDECLAQIGQPAEEQTQSKEGHFGQIFALRDMHLLALFVFVYLGIEITIGGWMVTYIINVRGGGSSSGYISSAFFGGLMTGRVALLWLNEKVGERRVVFLYALLVVGLELVVWLVPSLVGNVVCISIIDILLGPMYPIAINHAGRVLPARLLTGSLGWISSFGQAGSALFPFITGAIASRAGIETLQPLLVAMTAFMTVLWAIIPSKSSRPTN